MATLYIHPIIGERIREVWEKSGKNQQDFSESIGIHKNTLYGYFYGSYAPTCEVLRRLCEKYKVSSDWILGIQKEEEHEIANKIYDRYGVEINQKADEEVISQLYLHSSYSLCEIAEKTGETESTVRWILKKVGYR